MHNELKKRRINRLKRKVRIRRNLRGNAVKPRLTVNKSNTHIYAQVIDDETGKTLFGIGSYDKGIRSEMESKNRKEIAAIVGEKIGHKLKEQKVETVIFDRGSYKYHGIIAALADAVRNAGIKL